MDAILREQARQMAEEMAGGVQSAEDLSEVMRMMSKTLIQRALDAEMNVHLGRTKAIGSSPGEEDQPATDGKRPLETDKKKPRTASNHAGHVKEWTPRGTFEF